MFDKNCHCSSLKNDFVNVRFRDDGGEEIYFLGGGVIVHAAIFQQKEVFIELVDMFDQFGSAIKL